MKMREVTWADIRKLEETGQLLRKARDKLKGAGVRKQLVNDLRSIIKRVEGAHRHAMRAFDHRAVEAMKKVRDGTDKS